MITLKMKMNAYLLVIFIIQFDFLYAINDFKVYWNVPTEKCKQFGIVFNLSQYSIIQNTNDKFYGDKVTIFYNPGRFPRIKNNESINGGIPQKADLEKHIKSFQDKVNLVMPYNFTGVAVLDFESYYPSYNMSSILYQKASKEWVTEHHPQWPEEKILLEATRTFNESSKPLFQLLLELGAVLRPNAKWGYYHYPYCHNYGPQDSGHCKKQVMAHNDQITWLFSSSTALYPSIYIFKKGGFSTKTRRLNSRIRLREAVRLKKKINLDISIYPYFWFRYHDVDTYLSGLDVSNTLGLSRIMGQQGAVVWGSSDDVKSKKKCKYLKAYVDSSLGPLINYIINLPFHKLKQLMKSKRKFKRNIKIVEMKNWKVIFN